MTLRIKKGDQVLVRRGANKGQTERVLGVERGADGRVKRVLVEHVHVVHRHTRAGRGKTSGGIVQKEAPIHVSNVMLVDPKTGQATRFGAGQSGEGRKIRVSKKSGSPV